jgi:hypothetical protein
VDICTPGKLEKYALATVGIESYVRFPRTVARHIFQACPLWIYTQSNITNISPIKNVSQNKIFSPLCLIKAVHNHITKEKAINHELVVAST